MVKKTIDELDDGEDTRTSAAIVAFQEAGGSTFKGSVRPNPEIQINVRNQAQLEASILGVNLEIADGTAVTVSIDDSFTLTKPFLIGDGSSLEIFSPNFETVLTYDDTGNTLFQQNTANPIRALVITNMQITAANSTEILMDGLVGSSRFFMTKTRFTNFANLGEIECPRVDLDTIAPVDVKQGFILTRVGTLLMGSSLIRNASSQGTTFISVISDGVILSLFTDGNLTSQLLSGDTMFYLDPLAAATTKYIVKDTPVIGGGDFYQLGVNANADAIAGAPAGSIRLTVTAHGLNVGQVVNITDFVVNAAAYNITTPVTAIVDVNTVEVRGTFGTAETGGNLNANSLDSTSVLVESENNTGVPDSMSHAEIRTGATLTVDGSGMVDVPIEDLTPAPGDWVSDANTEEFSVDTSTGVITYNGIGDKTFLIQYQLTAFPTTGGAQVIDFDVHINGTVQPKSTTTLDTAIANITTYVGGLFVLSNGDTVQLFKDNTTNNNNTDISVATVLITAS